ncbi:MAG: hypothetical protein ABSF28_23160 [Terracidiphilus sp.]|jgi:hypothetical protein
MRRTAIHLISGLAIGLLFSTIAQAKTYRAADFPLRVHIFQHSSHSHYENHYLEGVDGEGRANLYENGDPRGFDYSYHCANRMMNSIGYETFRARWKKPGRLELLLPAMGDTCELKVDLKDDAYYRGDKAVREEPAAEFKAWMIAHQYDPEHGKNEPVGVEGAGDPSDTE